LLPPHKTTYNITAGAKPLPYDLRIDFYMGMAKLVKALLLERDMTMTGLAGILGKTVQNMSAKLRRDNLSEKELQDIAKACDAKFSGSFILNDTGKEIK